MPISELALVNPSHAASHCSTFRCSFHRVADRTCRIRLGVSWDINALNSTFSRSDRCDVAAASSTSVRFPRSPFLEDCFPTLGILRIGHHGQHYSVNARWNSQADNTSRSQTIPRLPRRYSPSYIACCLPRAAAAPQREILESSGRSIGAAVVTRDGVRDWQHDRLTGQCHPVAHKAAADAARAGPRQAPDAYRPAFGAESLNLRWLDRMEARDCGSRKPIRLSWIPMIVPRICHRTLADTATGTRANCCVVVCDGDACLNNAQAEHSLDITPEIAGQGGQLLTAK